MDTCLFCRIAARQIPAHVVYEDPAAVAVLDVRPRAPGHTMVLPRVHAETILDLPASQVGPVFEAVRQVTDLIKRSLHPDGFTIGINHGMASGQTVNHLHIHVIPRWLRDGGGSIHTVVDNPGLQSVEEVAQTIARNVNPV